MHDTNVCLVRTPPHLVKLASLSVGFSMEKRSLGMVAAEIAKGNDVTRMVSQTFLDIQDLWIICHLVTA